MKNDTRPEDEQFIAYEKFQKPPFKLICRNESLGINKKTLEPIHWTEVYEIDWQYIEEIYLPSKDNINR